jgi:predicted CoA-binding protein
MADDPRLARARDFMQARRIALVGASRQEKDFSRAVMRELLGRGHDVVPVNPGAAEVEGRRAFARVADVDPPADAALLLTPPARTADAVRDALGAGVRRIWLHRGGGPGAATPEAVALCRAAGVEPVTDLCPFMVLGDAPWPHRLHAWFRRASLRRRDAAAAR